MIYFMKMKRFPYILTLTVAVLAFVTCQKRPELKIYNLELTDETVTAADNSASAAFSSNIISESDWTDILEANGAIFLPTAGYRIETAVYDIGSYGHYWSSNYYNSDMAYGVNFSDSNLSGTYRENRSYGQSVRLVRSAE